ncbi:hypothetical protein DBR06_SOUSAS9010063, partial [Sousa chinensis]
TWPILWILHLSSSYSHCIHRLCVTRRTNIILRSNRYY